MGANSDGGQPVNSDTGNGQPPPPEPAGGERGSTAVLFTPEQERYLDEFVRRTVQGKEDRATAKLDRRVGEIEKIVAMRDAKMTPDQINRELVLEEMIQERSRQGAGSGPGVSTTTPAPGQAAPAAFTQIYGVLGLDANDPEVVKLSAENANDQNKLVGALRELAFRRASGAGAAAGAVTLPGGAGASPNLNAQIEQAAAKLEAAKRPNEIIQAQRELDALTAQHR